MNESTIDGKRYVAKPQRQNVPGCTGCAAESPRLLASERNALCRALPACSAGAREDRRPIIWLLADA